MNLHEYDYFESLPTCPAIRASKSVMDEFVVPSDSLPAFNQTTLILQVEVGELENSSINLPPSSATPHTHNSSISFDYEFDVFDEVLSPPPPSFSSFGPPDCELLCSPVLNVSLNVRDDQVLDGVGVPHKTSMSFAMTIYGSPHLKKNLR